MSNKTSDNVANIERLNNFANMTFLYGNRVNLNVSGLKELQKSIKNILSDYTRQKQINEEHRKLNGELRERVKELERNSNCDSVYAIKFATMQQQINEKDKRIQELEEENSKLKEYCKELIKEKQELTTALLDSIPTQVVIDKIEEIFTVLYEKHENDYADIQDIITEVHGKIKQKLLGGESK